MADYSGAVITTYRPLGEATVAEADFSSIGCEESVGMAAAEIIRTEAAGE